MSSSQMVNIDVAKLQKPFSKYVREKALAAGSTIVYVANGNLVEEDPRSGKLVVLKAHIFSR